MGTQYYATVKAEVPRVIRCNHCREEFLYFMRKTGTGMVEPFFDLNSTKSYQQATEIARQNLAAQLTPDNFNVVPCRYCFRYPSFMRERAAKLKFGHNRYIGLLIVGLGLVVGLIGVGVYQSPQNRSAGVWVLAAGVGGVLLGFFTHWLMGRLIAKYDPNNQSEAKRRQLADERCMTWSEFDREQAERLAREYQEHAAQQKRGRWLAKAENREPPAPSLVWLPSRHFVNGLSLPLWLAPDKEVTVELAPDAYPGGVIDLVPGDRNELPFQIVLLAISDFYNDLPDDEG